MSIPQYLLNLAGEYRVCSELNKRGVFATVTYGNRKSVDVYAISDGLERERALKIEVKTTQEGKFVTRLAQKYSTIYDVTAPDFWDRVATDTRAPDFWVLFQTHLDQGTNFEERFFVLTHKEICAVQKARNQGFLDRHFASTGEHYDVSKGVDNVMVADVEQYEDKWKKILDLVRTPADASAASAA